MNYQKLIIVGNVIADPKQAVSKHGDVTYASFRVAVSERKDDTMFFPVAAFGKLGENVARFVTRGREVLVEGRVRASVQSRFGVVADRVVFGTSPKEDKAEKPQTQD